MCTWREVRNFTNQKFRLTLAHSSVQQAAAENSCFSIGNTALQPAGPPFSVIPLWRTLRHIEQVLMRTSQTYSFIVTQPPSQSSNNASLGMRANGNFSAQASNSYRYSSSWHPNKLNDEPEWRVWPGVASGLLKSVNHYQCCHFWCFNIRSDVLRKISDVCCFCNKPDVDRTVVFFPNFLYFWDDIDLDSCFLSFFNQFLNLMYVW